MKAICSVEKIKNAISLVERITGKNLTLPVLNSILITTSGKSIKLRATNLSLGVEVEIPAKVEKEGVAAVSGQVLSGVFLSTPQNDSVEIDGDNGNLTLKTKKSRIKVKGQPHDDFPTIPTVEGKSFKIDATKLLDGIKSVYYSASVSDIKPEISSVYIYTNDAGIVFVATDSFRLAEKKIKYKWNEEIPGLLIPFKNIPEIMRVLGEIKEEIEVNFNKNQIAFSASNIYLTSRIIDGVFPDYRQIMPKESKTEAVLLKQDLLNALKLSNIFSDKFNQVNLKVSPKDKTLELSSANMDVGENKTQVDGALTGELVELGFNYRYFLDCFQSIASDSVSLSFNTPSKPIVVKGVSDNSFTYLVMPMNR